ncbi:PEST proteolytic signal-containing nuclear protein-like [Haliotis asinina]|uniref:PEST proteolytic signal-containing nuclear protein-like n=1 Tax=Haliotis asinina TaxID=109174 RepID=UPI003531B2AC
MADKLPPGVNTERPERDSPEKRKLADDDSETAPPVKKKFSMGFSSKLTDAKKSPVIQIAPKQAPAPIKMSLSTQKPKDCPATNVLQKNAKVAAIFNPDDESDEEEMPPEAKMRMRNIGRDTPTAAGPNSFGKNRLGFCDRQKIMERELKAKMDNLGEKK